MKFRWPILVLAAAILLAGCAHYQRVPLPADARWVDTEIWTPYGQSRAVASAVCDGGDSAYETQPYRDGELVECTYAVREVQR